MFDPFVSLEQQAATVYLRRLRGDWAEADQAELEAWQKTPARAAALRRVERVWNELDLYSASPQLLSLRAQTLRHTLKPAPFWGSTGQRWTIAAAFAAVLVGVTFGFFLHAPTITTYSTGAFEQRLIELADHSIVALDVRTELRVTMSARRRTVELLGGQAQFMVIHDPRRPFVVKAGASTITDVGTSFNVDYEDARAEIDLVTGKVLVAVSTAVGGRDTSHANPTQQSSSAIDRKFYLIAGDELNVEPDGRTRLLPNSDVAATIAWRRGKIIFHSTPLDEAIRRLNRYSSLQLELSDPSLSQERISGVFKLGDSAAFAEAAESSLHLVAQSAGRNRLRLAAP